MKKTIIGLASLLLASLGASASNITTWQYKIDKDEMREESLYSASLESLNSNEYAPPYSGGSKLKIILLSDDGSVSEKAGLILSNGQISCSDKRECKVYAKFDHGKIELVGTAIVGDSNDSLVIFDAKSFAEKLRIANSVFIEIPVYREGKSQFKFEPSGLNWRAAPKDKQFISKIGDIPLGEKIEVPLDAKNETGGRKCFISSDFKLSHDISAIGKANICTYDDYVTDIKIQYPNNIDTYKKINKAINGSLGTNVKANSDISIWLSEETGDLSSIYMSRSKKDGVSILYSYSPVGSLIPPTN